MEQHAQEIEAIIERNKRVEAEKAWETSFIRRTIIAIATYTASTATFWSIGTRNPWIQAFIPAIAYILSTLSLPWIRRHWIARHHLRTKT